jgi:hypothetical protein
VTKVVFSAEANPYPFVVPKFTSELDAWSVVQITVTEVLVRLVVATFEITGGDDTTDVVMKVALPEVADIAPAFAETTSKSYVVPSVNPVSVIVWLVTRVGSSVEADPYPFVTP